jgi:WD40 repeat protein
MKPTLLGRWKEHTDWVIAMASSADGTKLVSCACDHKVIVWDVSSTRELSRVRTIDGTMV